MESLVLPSVIGQAEFTKHCGRYDGVAARAAIRFHHIGRGAFPEFGCFHVICNIVSSAFVHVVRLVAGREYGFLRAHQDAQRLPGLPWPARTGVSDDALVAQPVFHGIHFREVRSYGTGRHFAHNLNSSQFLDERLDVPFCEIVPGLVDAQ